MDLIRRIEALSNEGWMSSRDRRGLSSPWAGYTILEVLVAVIVLAIVLPGLAAMVVNSRKVQVSSLRFENAAAFGQKVYDSLQLVPPTTLSATSGACTAIVDGQEYRSDWKRTPVVVEGVQVGGSTLEVGISWTVGTKTHRSVLTGALR